MNSNEHNAPDFLGGRDVFMTTRWSRVLLASDATLENADEALASLCRDYWRPLYYFARRKGHPPEDAQDHTQGFIMGLLEQNGVARADRERGRFRTFLLSAFSNFLANEHRGRTTLKRGGKITLLSLDEEPEAAFLQQAVHGMTPETQYERSWAMALLDRVMGRLREEYLKAERLALFETLQPHLSGADGRPGYARLGESLGMNESAITVAMHRMRRRYGELLREEIAATVATPEEVEDELRHLMNVVSGASAQA